MSAYHRWVTFRGAYLRAALAFASVGFFLVLGIAPASLADEIRYEGVKPGGGNLPPGSIRAGEGRFITFPGFQMLEDGRSRVFIQTATRMEPEVRRVERGFEIFLRDARIPLRTNRLPLETSYFKTPLERVAARQEKSGVIIHLTLREPVESLSPRVVEASDGYYFIFVDLPRSSR